MNECMLLLSQPLVAALFRERVHQGLPVEAVPESESGKLCSGQVILDITIAFLLRGSAQRRRAKDCPMLSVCDYNYQISRCMR